MSGAPDRSPDSPGRGSAGEVFRVFLKLGVTSFGGPIAHLAYFRDELSARRGWIDDAGLGDLVALCQFLPGPASSQVGFALGVLRGRGLLGGLAAWLGFTLPSALVMFAVARAAAGLDGPAARAALHGLKLVAVAVVAQAVWGMARRLTPDVPRAGIGLAAVAIVLAFPGSPGQIAAIGLGGALGLAFCGGPVAPERGRLRFPVSRRQGAAALALFAALLVAAPLAAGGGWGPSLFDSFYRSGALVFGGGHVVLPLLRAEFVAPGRVTSEAFLAGYGVAQAVPGPLFTFAAYLGAVAAAARNPATGAAVGLVAIFLPGLLLVYGLLPFWDELRARPAAQAAVRGANAAVVGVLGAALYNPLWINAISSPWDFALSLAGFLLLTAWRTPPWIVVALLVCANLLSIA